MKYKRFLSFCIIGNLLWVNLFSLAGYYFGNIPFVKKNFSIVVLAIIFISFVPPAYAFVKQFFKKETNTKQE
jgi:membrane-associated protein